MKITQSLEAILSIRQIDNNLDKVRFERCNDPNLSWIFDML